MCTCVVMSECVRRSGGGDGGVCCVYVCVQILCQKTMTHKAHRCVSNTLPSD